MDKAFYCDTCGVEISSGSKCHTCDPVNGTPEVTHTFMMYFGPEKVRMEFSNGKTAEVPYPEPTEKKPWWKLW